jgi:hypothetical protein
LAIFLIKKKRSYILRFLHSWPFVERRQDVDHPW